MQSQECYNEFTSQKLFNKIVGWLVLLKAVSVGYYWIMGLTVVAFFGRVSGLTMLTVIVICLAYAYWAFTVSKKQKFLTQKLFNQIFGTLCGLDAIVSFYYLFFNVKMVLGNQVFPTWPLLIITAIDIYFFYAAFNLVKKAGP